MMIDGVPGPKRIGRGAQARDGLLRGAALVGRAVGATLGPGGRAVLLERRHARPWISRDGYTVARHIALADRFEDMGGRLIRHVGSKVADEAGDGSTTAMVLAVALVEEGCKAAAAGAREPRLGRGIAQAAATALAALEAEARPVPARNGLRRVALLASGGDAPLADHIAHALKAVGRDGVVTVEDGKGMETDLAIHQGMSFDKGHVSAAFATDPEAGTATLEHAYVLLHEKTIATVDAILPALRAFAKSRHSLLIVAEDVVGEALTTLTVNKRENGLRVAAVKAPGFGRWRKPMLEDIAVATGGEIVSDELGNRLEDLKPRMLGSARTVKIDRERTTIIGGGGDAQAVAWRCDALRREAEAEKYLSFDREKLQERLARLAAGIAELRVGGATETELRARKERADDALNAARAALEGGVVPGGGVALLRASRALDGLAAGGSDEAMGAAALRAALAAPFRRIVENAGFDGAYAAARILAQDDPAFGFDAAQGRFRNLLRAGIADPAPIVRTALAFAVSAATRIVASEVAVAGFPREPEEKQAFESPPPGGPRPIDPDG